MTKRNKRARHSAGYTLIELMLVVAIMGVLISIVAPRIDLVLQRASQSATKGNLGNIRSAIGIYYADLEGRYPFTGYTVLTADDEYISNKGTSLSEVLVPKYINRLPAPILKERLGTYNGLPGVYDEAMDQHMKANPKEDIVIIPGPQDAALLRDRPWVYDPATGLLYLCNNNFDYSGSQYFYMW